MPQRQRIQGYTWNDKRRRLLDHNAPPPKTITIAVTPP
ncbi:predicted protein [Botrytis cinerea T4]|uniref:Uncharacterized protein n=1 Tax=Botryotinia fuckeliana (strain T4) TaxID=999810 RepID=G2XTL3_BOTF4|nr:predicted protein [Botrytis cinerea T4]